MNKPYNFLATALFLLFAVIQNISYAQNTPDIVKHVTINDPVVLRLGEYVGENIQWQKYDDILLEWTNISGQNDEEFSFTASETMYYRAQVIAGNCSFYSSIVLVEVSQLGVVETEPITEITGISAISGGNIITDNGLTITERGVVWSTSGNPTVDEHTGKTLDGGGVGPYVSNITGLTPNTNYYLRAYATNADGTSYGEEETFVTLTIPAVVSTTNVTKITDKSALSGGNITSNGGDEISARGMVWSTTQNPTIENYEGITSDGTGVGSWVSEIANLNPSTTYYIRAYATNSVGTSYGQEQSFTTFSQEIYQGLVAYYPFSGNANDESGNENHGTVSGATLTTNRFGHENNAYSFNAENQRIDIGNVVSFGRNDSYSISLWVKPTSLQSSATILSNLDENNDKRGIWAGISSNGEILLQLVNSTQAYKYIKTPAGAITANEWSMVTLIQKTDVNNIEIWVNNQMVEIIEESNSLGTNDYSSSSETLLGHSTVSTTRLIGTMDDVYIFNTALAQTEINQLYGNFHQPPTMGATSIAEVEQNSAKLTSTVISDGGKPITQQGFVLGTTPNPTLENGITVNDIDHAAYDQIVYYPFNGNANDESGNGNNGTVHEAILLDVDRFGQENSTYSFNGSTAYIVSTTNVSEANFTLSVWFKTTTPNGGIFSVGNGNMGTTGNDRHVYLSSGNLKSRLWSDEVLATSGTNYADGNWHQIVYSFGPSKGQSIYVDGMLKAQGVKTSSDFVAQDRFHIGYSNDASPEYFNGILDDVRIYNKALPEEVISQLYTSTSNESNSFTYTADDLIQGQKYYVRSFATNAMGTSYGEETSFTTQPGLPIVTSAQVIDINPVSAKGGGEVTHSGGTDVTARGMVWATTQNPTLDSNLGYTEDGTGLGSFTTTITGLGSTTTYFARAYATNVQGTAYGELIEFTTPDKVPLATTAEVTEITHNSATLSGEATEDWEADITIRGFVWGTTENPTVDENAGISENGSGLGEFTQNLTELTYATTYYVRSYATNATGTGYGNIVSLTTNAIAPTITTSEVTSVTGSSAITGGEISEDGGADVTARGVVWSTANNPTLANYQGLTEDGEGTGAWVSELHDLTPSTTYYVRAYATNSVATSYGEEYSFTTSNGLPALTTRAISNLSATSASTGGDITSDEGFPVTQRGVVWSSTANPSLETNDGCTEDGEGLGTWVSVLTELTPSTSAGFKGLAQQPLV